MANQKKDESTKTEKDESTKTEKLEKILWWVENSPEATGNNATSVC